MFPLDLPARDVLRLPGTAAIGWAAFDPAWYRATYPDVSDADPAGLLSDYLAAGQALGHAPNRYFDETWHRATYPTIARGVADGRFASAFDAYCRGGCLDRSAHWLFDERAYRDRYQDLTDDILAQAGLANGYDHYLRHGVQEHRVGHLLFDPEVYLTNFDARDAEAIRETGVFQHYLHRIESTVPDLRISIYFDPDWYLRRYPEIAGAVAARRWKCALHHYLCNDDPTAFDPCEQFSEAFYLGRDPGLKDVIASRHFRNGYAHFLRFGARELRAPSAAIDLARYASQPAVRGDIGKGRVPNAFAHWLTIGGAPSVTPDTEPVTDIQAAAILRQTDLAMLPVSARFGCSFECATQPMISVVMLPRDDFEGTMATLMSLRSNTTRDIQLVIVDRGSLDQVREIDQYVRGASTVRFEADIGWAAAADIGRQLASAPTILFLAGNARLGFTAVEQALHRLTTDASTGAVGGMILQPRGVIAQAGGILWNDGGIHDYQRGASPLSPEANFVRAADFCSQAFLMVRRDLLNQLGGFDPACAPGYPIIDLCLRIAAAGSRVVYDPSNCVFQDANTDRPAGPGRHFLDKHHEHLTTRHLRGGPIQAFARHAGPVPHRVLFIEDTIPLRNTGSGFVRSSDLIRVIASLGCFVTVYPVNVFDLDLAPLYRDMPDNVEMMYTHALDRLKDFLAGRPLYYDTIWVARTHNLERISAILRQLQAAGALKARVVLDTEAITPQREAIQARLMGQHYDLDAAMDRFVGNAGMCQAVIAVTEVEAALLRDRGLPNVAMIGHMITPRPTPWPFDKRAGLLFVGAIHQHDSPNLDSLVWFVDEVLPLVEQALGWETRLTIAGYTAPGIDLQRFERHTRITLRGSDLATLYATNRIFVAPTRFAAGAPYKVLEAAAHGLPVVATELLREQLGWAAGESILTAPSDDPAAFAAEVVRLYRQEGLWRHLRETALATLRRENGVDTYAGLVATALKVPHRTE